jgi:hypothetical protein
MTAAQLSAFILGEAQPENLSELRYRAEARGEGLMARPTDPTAALGQAAFVYWISLGVFAT